LKKTLHANNTQDDNAIIEIESSCSPTIPYESPMKSIAEKSQVDEVKYLEEIVQDSPFYLITTTLVNPPTQQPPVVDESGVKRKANDQEPSQNPTKRRRLMQKPSKSQKEKK